MEMLKEGYERLYRCTQAQFPAEDYTRFVAIRGERYDALDGGDDPRLMIVGRAVNGWDRERKRIEYDSPERFAESALACFRDNSRFTSEWQLESRENGRYSCEASAYHLSRSRFWSDVGCIRRAMSHRTDADWLRYIAWSNLYKVSPRHGGNPNGKLCRAQAEACVEILRAEIRLLKPTHILMPVGDDWFSWRYGDFSGIFTDGSLCTAEMGTESLNREIVKRVFGSGNLRMVVTCRPERCKRQAYVQAVLRAFGMDGACGKSWQQKPVDLRQNNR